MNIGVSGFGEFIESFLIEKKRRTGVRRFFLAIFLRVGSVVSTVNSEAVPAEHAGDLGTMFLDIHKPGAVDMIHHETENTVHAQMMQKSDCLGGQVDLNPPEQGEEYPLGSMGGVKTKTGENHDHIESEEERVGGGGQGVVTNGLGNMLVHKKVVTEHGEGSLASFGMKHGEEFPPTGVLIP